MEKENDILHMKLARQVGGAIACLLALALLLGLTACGGGQSPEPADETPVEANDEPAVQPDEPPVSPEPPAVQEPVTPPMPPDEDDEEHDGFPELDGEEEPTPAVSHEFTQEAFDQAVADVLDAIIKDDMTPLEQAKAVFNYAHNNIRYIGHADKSDWMNGAYVGLTTGKGDCFTYYAVSRALLTALEIDNLEVQRAGGKTQHFWNLVNCGDGWYHFDACPRNLKMPSFNSFMVTDEQIAAFTAMAGRNYYDFDGSLLPERATEIVTNTRPIPRPPEPEEDAETPEGEGEEPTVDPNDPMLPPEEGTEADPANPEQPSLEQPSLEQPLPEQPPAEQPGPVIDEGGNPEPGSDEPPVEVWTEPPVEEWTDPSLNGEPVENTDPAPEGEGEQEAA